MVLEVELGNLFDHVVVGVGCKHYHSIVAESDLLGVKFAVIVILITGSEPVGVVRRVSVAAIIVVVRLLLLLRRLIGSHDLLVVRGQRELFIHRLLRSGRMTLLSSACWVPLRGDHRSLLLDNGLRNA